MLFHLAWKIFVIGYYCQDTNFKSYTWQAPVSSVCGCILILMANMFLACRIYGLTESRLQSGLIVVLSATAFVFGVSTVILPWASKDSAAYISFDNTAENATMIIWHVLQAISEFFISAFLIRALLNNRTGFKKSDSLVQYLMRRVIELGLFAAIWSFAGVATWFLLPRYTIYALFEMTVGAIYTHVGVLSPQNLSIFTGALVLDDI